MAGRIFAVSLVILALPAVAAAQQLPVEGTTVPVYEGSDPALLPPPANLPPPAQAASQLASTDPAAAFLEPLSAYGSWISLDGFGLVWQPDTRLVGATFTPYVTAGRWELTQVGWQFTSELPFAWAVFHYGRWLYDSQVGWVWAPDTEWGASWVDWQQAGTYVGWAPLPPAGYAYPAGYGPSYVFISVAYLMSYDLWPYLVMGAGVRRYVEMGMPCGYASYDGRGWPYGPNPGVVRDVMGAYPSAATIPVPPAGRVYRGAVEVNVPPGGGAVEVRTPGGGTAGSVVVRTPPAPGAVVVSSAGAGLPPAWRSSAMLGTPRWGANPGPVGMAMPPPRAPMRDGLPGIHSVVTLPSRGMVAPRYAQQASAFGRAPPMPSWAVAAAARGTSPGPMAAAPVAAWRGPSNVTGAPSAFGGIRPTPSFAGGGFQPTPSWNGGGVRVGAPSFGGGGFAGGGFHASAPSMPAPSFAPSFAPGRPAPSFGGGGGFGGGAVFNGGGGGGGFHPAAVGGVGVRSR